MSHVLFDLEHNRKKLLYYTQLRDVALSIAQDQNPKTKAGAKALSRTPYDKWVEIYTERVARLERQAGKLGLRTQLKRPSAADAQNRA